jgi:hypothetical protein
MVGIFRGKQDCNKVKTKKKTIIMFVADYYRGENVQ